MLAFATFSSWPRRTTPIGCVLPLLTVMLLFSGCTDKAKLDDFDKRTAELEKQLGDLKLQVERLSSKESMNELFKNMDSTAYLTPGSTGYSVIQADLGRLTVSLENVQPYANGSRVTLRIGNLTSATINGAKATVEWGKVDDKGTPLNESAKSQEVGFVQPLKAGSWTNVQVVLEAVPPQDLGFVRVKDLSHTGVSLLTK